MVRRHDGRPAAAVRASRSDPSSRSPRGASGSRSDRRCRPSRTRGGSASARRAARSPRARRPADGSGRAGPRGPTGRPCPSARTATCGRCRSSRRRRARRRRPGPCPGAWAPSTSVSIPRRSISATSSATGRISAVGLVTWLTRRSRVRSVTAARIAASASSGPAIGKGIGATTTRAPSRAATARIALIVALYSWSSVRSSSPGSNRSDCRTVLTPVVALGTKARPSGIGAEEAPDRRPRLVEQARQLAGQEAHGLGFEAIAPRPLEPRGPAPGRRRTSRGSGT